MDKFLQILCVIASVVLPIISAIIVRFVYIKIKEIKTGIENENINNILNEAYEAISTAVIFTSQTFVEALKSSGSFNSEKQKEALSIALKKTYEMLSDNAISFIYETYGDIENWIITNIEKEVNLNK